MPGFIPVTEIAAQIIRIPESWTDASRFLPTSDEMPIICVVGNRNMGKSTFARYLVNKYLGKYELVAFLDCDIGQPELTPAGMVSLHRLSEPLIGFFG